MPRKAEPLTDRDIERMKATEKPIRIGVGGVPGLMLVVSLTGTKTFYATFRLKRPGEPKVTWFKLGEWEKPRKAPTPEDPKAVVGMGVAFYRHRAATVNQQVLEGTDPRAVRLEAASRPTWEDLCDLYQTHARSNLKPRTQKWAESVFRIHLRSAFPGRYVEDIRRGEMVDLHQQIKATSPIVADRALALLKKAFKLAIAKEWREDNPCTDLELSKTPSERNKFLDAGELEKLGEALRQIEEDGGSWRAVALVRLALFTGLRQSEILSLRWDEIDYEKGTITKNDHKTIRKTGKPLVQPLNNAAAEVLKELATSNKRNQLSPWVLPGEPARAHTKYRKAGGPIEPTHFKGAEGAWRMVCEKAGFEDVRFHDLRRTFASWGSISGQELNVVSKLLNHSNISVTSRIYAHADLAVKTEASNAISDSIKAALKGK